jgi:alpha-glucosidase
MNLTILFPLVLAALTDAAPAQDPAPVVISSIGASRVSLRLEALNEDVIRAWYSPAVAFVRQPSLATGQKPRARTAFRTWSDSRVFWLSTRKLIVAVDRQTLAISVTDKASNRRFIPDVNITEFRADGGWKLTEGIAADEHLLGLGEDNRNHGKLDRRGTIRELWAGQQINSGNVTAEYPIPFMLSTGPQGHSYGVFFDNTHRLRFDLGKTDPDRIRLDAAGGEADLTIINGPEPKDVISRYTLLTGRPSLPPLWTLGYIQSRCVFYNWSDVDSAYQGLTSRGFPVDAIVIDYQWPEFLNNFVWDKRWTVNGIPPGHRVGEYGKKGLNILLYGCAPMIVKDSPTHATGLTAGVFATDGNGKPIQCGYYGGDLLDFTAPNLNSWLWPQLRPHNLGGMNGWWLDLTEPEGEPPQTVYKGGRPSEIHNQYSMLVTRSFEGSELQDRPNQRPWILTRAGSAGIQAHHAALWTGDTNSDFATLAAHPGEMLNAGISGINAWTCDTGGFLTGYYRNDRFGAHARLYERWMQFSAFSPITRAHKAGLCMPYEFGPATEQGAKKYLNLRYRLLPYIYSHYWEASQTGIPLVRAMAIEFPKDPNCLKVAGDQYMFGSNLLVAPVVHEGISNRTVYFPPGKWIDWDYGYEYLGGCTWVVSAPQNRIPVAVRPGGIIPMAPEMANTASGKWDPLTVEVFPSGRSQFSMVHDDGRTFDYLRGKSTTTRFASDEGSKSVKFEIAESNHLFVPKQYVLRFHLDRRPFNVVADGKPIRCKWDEQTRILEASLLSSGTLQHTLTIQLSPSKLPARPAPKLVAEKVDSTGQAIAGGSPTPHFFPGPTLPNQMRAVDYDNGAEGIAYHVGHVAASNSPYRSDNAGIVRSRDTGGYVLAGLKKDDWARYTVDAGNGGYFDLVVHASGRGGQFHLISAARNITKRLAIISRDGWQDILVPNVYLNPGSDSLMLYVDQPGLVFDGIEFKMPASAPSVTNAEWAAFTGQVVVNTSETGSGSLGNVGQLRGSVTMGVASTQPGLTKIRIRYANGGRTISLRLFANDEEATLVRFPNTGGGDLWKDVDIPLALREGANRLKLTWNTNGYDSIALKSIEVLNQGNK